MPLPYRWRRRFWFGNWGLPEDPEIFTAALLHDVGKLALGSHLDDERDGIRRESGEAVPFQLVEQRVLGTDHADVGARILESWAFPERIVRAVRWHHDPDAADPPDTMVDLIHVANMLCLMIGIGMGNEGAAIPARNSGQRTSGPDHHPSGTGGQPDPSMGP